MTPKFEEMHFVVKCEARCQRIHRLGPEESIFANRNSLANRDIDFHRATLSILGITFMHQGSLLFVAFMLIGHSVMVWLVSLEAHSCDNRLP